MANIKTIIGTLQDYVPYYLARYVDWYMTPADKRQPWEDLCKCDQAYSDKKGGFRTPEYCEDNWLPRQDVQEYGFLQRNTKCDIYILCKFKDEEGNPITYGRYDLDYIIFSGIESSKNKSRILIEQGGISIDDAKITNPKYVIPPATLKKGYFILKKGKKVFMKIEIEEN